MVVATTIVYQQNKWIFVLWWLLANVISFGIAGGMFHNFPLTFIFPSTAAWLGTFELSPALFGAAFGAVPSILIGLLQWLILRRHLPVSGWWIFTILPGVGFDHFISDGFPNAQDLSIAVLASSALIGVLQWLVLRRQVNSFAWWIVATVVSWSMGVWIGVSILDASGLLSRTWIRGIDFQEHGLVAIVLAAVYSLMTAIIMGLILQRNRSDELTVKQGQSSE